MLIERINEWDLTPVDEERINRLLMAAFKEGFGTRSYYQQRHHLRFIVRDRTEVIGHMALSYRDIRLGGSLVPIIGLGEVATDPSHQGKGIATALLLETIAEARKSQAVHYLLFGVRPIYAGHGFRSVPNVVTHVDMHGAHTGEVATSEDSSLMVMELRGVHWDDTAPVDLLGHLF